MRGRPAAPQERGGVHLCAVALTAAVWLLPQVVEAAPSQKRTANILPPSIHGLWAYEPEDCDKPESDGHLTIEAKSVMFYASGYDVQNVVQRSDGSWRVSGLRAEEGETGRTRDSLTLKLVAPDQLHVVTGSPEGHTYHRCKTPPQPQK